MITSGLLPTIHVSFPYLSYYKAFSGGTQAAMDYIRFKIMPPMLNYFMKTLKVVRLTNKLTISYSTICETATYGAINVPSYLLPGQGIDADLVIFVRGYTDSGTSTIATAGACAYDSVTQR